MDNGIKRSIISNQLKMRMLNFSVVSEVAGGPDAAAISSIVDNGTGNYTITLSRPFYMAPVVQVTAITEDAIVNVEAVDYNVVTVQCRVSGADSDADFYMQLIGSDYERGYL